MHKHDWTNEHQQTFGLKKKDSYGKENDTGLSNHFTLLLGVQENYISKSPCL